MLAITRFSFYMTCSIVFPLDSYLSITAGMLLSTCNMYHEQSERPPQLSRENLLINELIREYLEYNKYKYTASVFGPETGLSGAPLERTFLADELNLHDEGNAAKVYVSCRQM